LLRRDVVRVFLDALGLEKGPLVACFVLQQGRRVLLGERRRRFDRFETADAGGDHRQNGDRDGDRQKKWRALMRRVFGVLGVFEMFGGRFL
jgi:hypothetical protein